MWTTSSRVEFAAVPARDGGSQTGCREGGRGALGSAREHSAEGRGVPAPARGAGCVRDAEPVGHRHGARARGARLQGARDDERRARLRARPARRRGRRLARGGARALGRDRRRDRPARQRRPRERLRPRPGERRGDDPRGGRRGPRRLLDRGLDLGRRASRSTRSRRPSSASPPAVEAAAALPFPFTLTARAENYLHGRSDLDDTIARLQAFEKAGADVLYAPGLLDIEDIRTVCASRLAAGQRARAAGLSERRAALGRRRAPHQPRHGLHPHRPGRVPARRARGARARHVRRASTAPRSRARSTPFMRDA